MALRTEAWVEVSEGEIFTSCRKRRVGQLWRRRKARREAVWVGVVAVLELLKKEVIGFWRNGWMPLMFQV